MTIIMYYLIYNVCFTLWCWSLCKYNNSALTLRQHHVLSSFSFNSNETAEPDNQAPQVRLKITGRFFGGLKLSRKDFQELDWSRLIWKKHPLHGDSYFLNVKEQLACRCDFSISKNTGHLRRWTGLLEVKQEIYC